MAHLIVLTVVAGCLLASQNTGAPAAKGLDRLQGEWVLIETADEKRPDMGDPAIRMVIHGNKVTMKFGAATTNEGTVTVGFCKMVQTIDMKFEENEPARMGVYELHGDVLLMSFDEPGKARPGGLIPKGTQWVEKWQKVNP